MSQVIDNSVFVSWFMPNEQPPAVMEFFQTARHESILLPPIWPLEFANVMGRLRHNGKLSSEALNEVMKVIDFLDIEIVGTISLSTVRSALRMMENTGLSSYDASYLALAQEFSLPLATLDEALADAARKAGIKLLL